MGRESEVPECARRTLNRCLAGSWFSSPGLVDRASWSGVELLAEPDVEAALESTKGSEGALERPECVPSIVFFASP